MSGKSCSRFKFVARSSSSVAVLADIPRVSGTSVRICRYKPYELESSNAVLAKSLSTAAASELVFELFNICQNTALYFNDVASGYRTSEELEDMC